MKTSNKFTLSRIILAPVIFLIYYIPVWVRAAAGSPLSVASVCVAIPLLAFAEFTDYLDGHFARKHNEVSDFGKMFDPFADVFLHLSMFTCFVFAGYMPVVFYVFIFYREFGQNFLRMVAAKQGRRLRICQKGRKTQNCNVCGSLFFCTYSGISCKNRSFLFTQPEYAAFEIHRLGVLRRLCSSCIHFIH